MLQRALRRSGSARATALQGERRKRLGQRIREHAWCYAFITPALILYLMFTVWPVLASWYFAFFDWTGLGVPTRYVGLDNFREVISNSYFWSAFKHSFQFMIGLVAVQLPTTLIMAIILNNPRLRAASIYRIIFFLPVVTTTAIVGIVMTYILSPFNGVVNTVLVGLGLVSRPIHFLGQASTALATLVMVSAWKGFGTNMMYWLAGLQAIPNEVYEAAKVDGANTVQTFFRITVPLLKPVGLVITLLTVVGALRVFDLVKVMTDGGPFFLTETISIFIYRYAFGSSGMPRIGFASAAGIFFGLAAMILSTIQGLAIRRGGSVGARGGTQ